MSTVDVISSAPGCPSNLEPATNTDIVDPAPFVRRDKAGLYQVELSVHGAHCGGCIAKIERGLTSIVGVESARLNLSTGKLAVAWANSGFAPIQIPQKLSALGYRAVPFDPAAAVKHDDHEGALLLRCLAVAGFAAANIMLLSVAIWAGTNGEMGPATRTLMHWVSAAIAIPAAAYAGRPFFRSALSALRAGRANMDVPISLAVFLALGSSVFETMMGGHEAYFDAAVMLLFFLLIGRYLDHRLRARSRDAAQDLLALQATTASRFNADGSVAAVSSRDVVPGDRLMIAPGDRAPVDGVVVEGTSNVDVSLVTGESVPALKKVGDTLYAGVLNMSSRLVLEARASVEDSLIADLTRLIEAGEQGKSKYVRLADRAAALYVPVVHSLALATFLGWFFIADAGARVSIMNAVAVLIITCPCALGLAAPAVQVVATGRLFKEGILVKSGDALERLAEVDCFVFDKTGTLTQGRLSLTNEKDLPAGILAKAAMLARSSRHPLARAIVAAEGAGPLADNIEEVPGCGVEGYIDGKKSQLGRADWVKAEADDSAVTETWFRYGDNQPVRLQFADHMREDTAETIAALRRNHQEILMLSGDREEPARRIANSAGIDDWRACLSPQDKIDCLKELSENNVKTVMIGDGLNDAPSLAAAHASISPGTAADATQAAADFIFQGDSLAPVLTAFQISKKARARVLENFGFAAFYNLCAIPLAVFGFVTPLIAALAMSGSSVIVTLNALRLSVKAKNRKPINSN